MASLSYPFHCLHVECWVIVLCLCNFGSWCGESRDQTRILPVGRRPARREGATVPDSDKTQHLLLLPSDRVQKQLAKVTPLAKQVTASRTVTVTHLHFQNTHPHIHTHTSEPDCVLQKAPLWFVHTHIWKPTPGFWFAISDSLKGLTSTLPNLKVSFIEWCQIFRSQCGICQKLVFLWSLKKPGVLWLCCAVYLLHVLWKSSLYGLCAISSVWKPYKQCLRCYSLNMRVIVGHKTS